ncbi:MAG: terminase large subunit [Mycoplasmoidaceae bacterium]|nr:terminase large subunit [Mycoplasmoidaceae bacterium]
MNKHNYIREYYEKISTGEILTSKKVKRQYELLVKELDNPSMLGDNWKFDIDKATYPIEFIERFCRRTQGTNIGEPIKLALFQKAKIQAVFGFVDKKTGFRRCREVATIEGRKNGKTTESGGLSLYALMGDGEGGAEVYFVATKKDQAKKGFIEAQNMVRQNPMLGKHLKKRQTDLYFGMTYSKMEALSSDSNTLDGLNTSYGNIDELHSIKDRNLYDVLKQSMTSREQPLLNIMSTNGFNRETIFDDQYEVYDNTLYEKNGFKYDGTVLSFIYELDEPDEWMYEENWIKANPGLDIIKSRKELRDNVKRAMIDDKFRRTVLVKDFNLKQSAENAWLAWEDLNNEETFDLSKMNFRYGIGGVDLSSTTDLTSAKMFCMQKDNPNIYIIQMYFLPEDLFEERCKLSEKGNDNVPYKIWYERGLLRLTAGNRIDYHYITDWFKELRDKYGIYLYKCGYDPWGSPYWVEEMKAEFGEESMEAVIQGAKTFSIPMKNLKADLQKKIINYNNNPIDKWCLSNTVIKRDENDNIRPIKPANQRKRIDGAMSLIDAYVIYSKHKEEFGNIV